MSFSTKYAICAPHAWFGHQLTDVTLFVGRAIFEALATSDLPNGMDRSIVCGGRSFLKPVALTNASRLAGPTVEAQPDITARVPPGGAMVSVRRSGGLGGVPALAARSGVELK
jgi:hypothetical protein